MPRKHNDARPRDKLLDLYQRLTLDGRKHFQSDLARDLGCSAQTVARLVEVIEGHLGRDTEIECGLEGRRRYYRLKTKTQERALGFNFEELHYLAVCRDLAGQFLSGEVAERITRSISSLALQLAEGRGFAGAGEPVVFRNKGFIDYTSHLQTIDVLRKAADKRQVCQIIYKANGRETAKSYRYAPGRVLAMNGTLYVQGYRMAEGSVLKERPTTFSLHRIAEAMPTGEYFTFNACDPDARVFGLNWHEPKRFRVHIAAQAADYVRDRIWSEDQETEDQLDGSIILTVSTTSERELQAWVWSFGDLARIICNESTP